MILKDAQELILRAVENPAANVATEELALAVATVLVRNGLLGMALSTTTLNIVTRGEASDA